MDNVREDMKEKKSKTTRIWKRPKTKKEVWRSLVRASSSFLSSYRREKREKKERKQWASLT